MSLSVKVNIPSSCTCPRLSAQAQFKGGKQRVPECEQESNSFVGKGPRSSWSAGSGGLSVQPTAVLLLWLWAWPFCLHCLAFGMRTEQFPVLWVLRILQMSFMCGRHGNGVEWYEGTGCCLGLSRCDDFPHKPPTCCQVGGKTLQF